MVNVTYVVPLDRRIHRSLGLPYHLENSGHVRNVGLNFASGRIFEKFSNVQNFMMSVLGELELRE